MIERLTAADIFLLMWDDYGWSSELGALAILDREELLDPDGHVRTEVVRERALSVIAQEVGGDRQTDRAPQAVGA